MSRLKIFFVILSFSFLFTEGRAQVAAMDSLPAAAGTTMSKHLPVLHKLDVSIRTGSEFMTTSGYGSAFSTFLSPALTYPVSRKFSLSGGVSIVNTSLYGIRGWSAIPEGSSPSFSGNFTQATLWVSGQYFLNDRITLTGTAYKTFDLLSDKPGYTPFYKTNPQGAFLNVGYKVSDHLRIEAGFAGYFGR
jgi:hypothetical protein